MAIVSGFSGNVAVTTLLATIDVNVHSWSLNLQNDVFSYRTFTQVGGATTAKGGYVCTGTCSGMIDSAAVITESEFGADQALSAFVLTAASGVTYTFSAHIHNIRWAASMNSAPATLEFDFTSSGDLATAP